MRYLKQKQATLIFLLSFFSFSCQATALAPPAGTLTKQRITLNASPFPRLPHVRSNLPPSPEQQQYDVGPTNKPRYDLMTPAMRRQSLPGASNDCHNMDKLAGYHGAALADYVASLPDSDCANELFSVTPPQTAKIYTAENLAAITQRYVKEAAAYRSTNNTLLNLTLFLRAAYYLSYVGPIVKISPAIMTTVRPALMQLVAGTTLLTPNPAASTTAGETLTLITNMHDEAYYLDVMQRLVARFTNTPENPRAALALTDTNVGYGFTGILKIFYYAHYRDDALVLIKNNPSYAKTLYNFTKANKSSLITDTHTSYQLDQAATEAFRFAMHPTLLDAIRPLFQDALSSTTMTGPDKHIWLAAAQAVKYYDNTNCNLYGSCNFEIPLAAAVLSQTYNCPNLSIRLRTQELTLKQANQACQIMGKETAYFHQKMHTTRIPVKDDYNRALEVVIFSNSSEYELYSTIFFGNDTNNGGIYLEGDPSSPTNQARFIAFEADWLRPQFEIWNLKHEYIHYLDGRFDMYGDFNTATQVPVVWYLEGLAEYLSRQNDNQEAIDAAKTGQYRLSEIFNNIYSMPDYVNRAYRWGYMAVRFVFERHPEILTSILPKFRGGDYPGYQAYMTQLPAQLDAEFAAWVPTVQANVITNAQADAKH